MKAYLIFLFVIGSFFQLEANTSVDSLNNKAWSVRNDSLSQAITLSKQALDLSEKGNYLKGEGNSNNLLGVFYKNKGDYNQAEQFFIKASAIRKKLDDKRGEASVYNNLMSLKRRIGDYPKAIEYGFEAERICSEINDRAFLAKVYKNLSNTYDNFKDTTAFDYAKRALNIYKELEEENNIADAEYNLGNRYFNFKQFDQAEKHYISALKYDWNGKAKIYEALANIYVQQKDFNKARLLFDTSILLKKSFNDTLGLLYSYLNLSDLYKEQKDYTTALDYCKNSEIFLAKRGGIYERVYLANQFSDLYNHFGEYQKAYQYKTEVDSLKDLLNDEAKNKQLAQYMYERGERERVEKEKFDLERQKAIAARQLYFILSLFLLLLLVSGIYYYYQKQQSNKKILEQEQQIHQQEVDELMKDQELKFISGKLKGEDTERERIARELHDNLGSMMVSTKWYYDNILEELTQEQKDTSKLKKANDLFTKTYEELRQLSHKFGSNNIKRTGLVTSLKDLSDTISESGKIKITLTSHGSFETLGEKIEISLYRVVQELISNTLKYAEATKIDIQLNQIDDELNIMIEDNGKGFDPYDPKSNGIGLKNIAARIRNLNGTFDIDSGKGNGTTAIVNIPLSNYAL